MNLFIRVIGFAGLLLGCSSPAVAAVVLVSTPELNGIDVGIGNWWGMSASAKKSWECDFDGDGTPEVLVSSYPASDGNGIYAQPYPGVEILVAPYRPFVLDSARACGFAEGDLIDVNTPNLLGPNGAILWGNRDFRNGYFHMLTQPMAGGQGGAFATEIRYLGVRFQKNDGTHYGWIGASGGFLGLGVFDYAWETEPNTAIAAGLVPEAHSALLLGTASILLAMTRRRKAGA